MEKVTGLLKSGGGIVKTAKYAKWALLGAGCLAVFLYLRHITDPSNPMRLTQNLLTISAMQSTDKSKSMQKGGGKKSLKDKFTSLFAKRKREEEEVNEEEVDFEEDEDMNLYQEDDDEETTFERFLDDKVMKPKLKKKKRSSGSECDFEQ